MNIIIVGSGGREHAIAWMLAQSDAIRAIYCVPGNGGTATTPKCRNVPLAVLDFVGIAQLARDGAARLVVVGPEDPLAAGLVDYLQAEGIAAFGPTRAGAQIESSKAWAKALMAEAKIPTAAAQTFTEPEAAIAYVRSQPLPIVVKADGLAAGKGVTVAQELDEAVAAVQQCFGGQFGDAGRRVVVEEYLQGQEASVLAVTDGVTIRPLLPAQDHKAIGEGDTGPNTGGMGAYAPTPVVSEAQLQQIEYQILKPAIAALRQRGIDYRGVLYAGLMITPSGEPKVVEFNCRFGDPETQVVLPLLETPLEQILVACAEQRLTQLPPLAWKSGAAACIVLASGGYPGTYRSGYPVEGLDRAQVKAMVFHAGTRQQDDHVVTAGGRVLGVTALGPTFNEAIARAYSAVDDVRFTDHYYRRDIGHRVRE